MNTHNLKTWPEFYARIEDGSKPFEVREMTDRKFEVGDLLRLHEFEPCKICGGSGTATYHGISDGVKVSFYSDCGCLKTQFPRGFMTGKHLERHVSYLTDFGQKEGWVVMGLKENNKAE